MAEFFGKSRMWPGETFQLKSCSFSSFFFRSRACVCIPFFPSFFFSEENPETKVNRSEPAECAIAWRPKFIHLLRKNCSGCILSGLFLFHFRLGSVNAKNMKWRFRRWSSRPSSFPLLSVLLYFFCENKRPIFICITAYSSIFLLLLVLVFSSRC